MTANLNIHRNMLNPTELKTKFFLQKTHLEDTNLKFSTDTQEVSLIFRAVAILVPTVHPISCKAIRMSWPKTFGTWVNSDNDCYVPRWM